MKSRLAILLTVGFVVGLKTHAAGELLINGRESGGDGHRCSVSIESGKSDYSGKKYRVLEYMNDFGSTSFTIQKENNEVMKGSFERHAPSSSWGFGDYTPEEKSNGTIEVLLEEKKAHVKVENCTKRRLIPGFRCKRYDLVCSE
ncbi:MAG: hypothetical protein OXB88_08625 [Bacteriovoracales bacterium]|nr:hypothetical protein [Bacteriovoracales bacterium]